LKVRDYIPFNLSRYQVRARTAALEHGMVRIPIGGFRSFIQIITLGVNSNKASIIRRFVSTKRKTLIRPPARGVPSRRRRREIRDSLHVRFPFAMDRFVDEQRIAPASSEIN
jgi:hypothetical protein